MFYDEERRAIAVASTRFVDARTSKDRLLELLERAGCVDKSLWTTSVKQR
ncbi:MAG: hypothetical protein RLZZ366_926 [Pseudomonadota bacterium]|jgi:hypothetical protein